MRVVSMINGSLLSESASLFALAYAQSVQLPLTLLFIDNGHESVEKFEASEASLTELAEAFEVPVDTVVLKGATLDQLRDFLKLHAVDTLFCATRKESNRGSFSEEIVHAGVETDIAVVKVKNIGQIRSAQRLLFVAGSEINMHAYLLWIALMTHGRAFGKIYLQNGKKFQTATTKSGLKYEAAPFVQMARMLGKNVDIVNAMKPVNAEDINHYLVGNNMDLAIYYAPSFQPKLLDQITDISSVNAILFYPWQD